MLRRCPAKMCTLEQAAADLRRRPVLCTKVKGRPAVPCALVHICARPQQQANCLGVAVLRWEGRRSGSPQQPTCSGRLQRAIGAAACTGACAARLEPPPWRPP